MSEICMQLARLLTSFGRSSFQRFTFALLSLKIKGSRRSNKFCWTSGHGKKYKIWYILPSYRHQHHQRLFHACLALSCTLSRLHSSNVFGESQWWSRNITNHHTARKFQTTFTRIRFLNAHNFLNIQRLSVIFWHNNDTDINFPKW